MTEPRDQDQIVEPTVEIATGDRREGVHYVPEPGQVARAVHQVKPAGPLPEDERSTEGDPVRPQPDVPLQDVRVTPSDASVWEARSPGRSDAGDA